MPLKSLTINGFKSFADKTKIDFTSGITGIVGPNGSGKSNITEAIRWVMGEQSAKSLRGDKMVDIIFAGSATRPQMNHAEVILEFDNSNKELKSDQNNITIKRKLFRNGDAEFSINNKSCRLRDITELFMDSGMGKQSFSIISQGRVEEIFNSKPIERRSIIEESAGIALFKQKKTQAESRLSETTDNLHRVSDIVSELSKQVEPLKEQASIARDYKEQKNKYDNIYQQILTIEIKDLSKAKRETESKLREVKLSLQNIEKQVKNSNEHVTRNRNETSEIVKKIDFSQDELVRKTQSLEILNGKVAVSDERNGFNTTNQTSLNEQLQNITKSKIQHEKKLSDCNIKIEQYKEEISSYSKRLKEIEQLQKKTPEEIQNNISNLRDSYVNTLQEQVSTGNEQKFTQRQLDRIKLSDEDINNQLEDIKKNLKETNISANEVSEKLQHFIDDNQDLIKKNDELDRDIKNVTETGQSENQEYLKSLENLQETKARKTVLDNMQQEHVGFFEGAKNVLNNQDKIGGIIGAVAELIKVPQEYQLAIETVVSNQLQAIVTKDEPSAKEAISFLRKRNGGRATFLPINIIRGRSVNSSDLNALSQVQGYIGVASELVKFDSKVENIVKNILGNLLIVKDINAATRASSVSGRKYRVVTLDGNVVNAGGSMTGGQQRRVNSSILTRKDELVKLNSQLSKQEMALDQKQQTVVDLREKLVNLRNEKKQIESKLSNFNQERNQLSNQLSSYQSELKHLQEQKKAVEYNGNKNDEERKQLKKNLDGQLQGSKELQKKVTDLQSDIEANQKLLKDFDSELTQITSEIQQTQTKLAVVKSNQDNELKQKKQFDQEILDDNDKIKELKIRLDQLNSERDQLTLSNSEVKTKITELNGTIKSLKLTLSDLQKQRSEKEQVAVKLNDEAQRSFDLQKSASDEQENLAISVTKITNKIDTRLDVLSEEYQLTYEAAMKNLKAQDLDPDDLKREAKLLKMGIDELGTVNLSSIDEYDKVKDRYEFLTTQQNDLLKARQQLLDTMSEMDHEVSTRFKKTFDNVSAAFEMIFPEMFAGGRAKLVLTDPTNLLETGIEIIAQPPGKKFQRLSLLSGGEKALTAITLLFAIIKVHPVPFCILDEVEASLDDANVDRFASYLNRYDDNTEFIVITHRKGTMMNVNRLYGVTMEESGVSRMLSVEVQNLHNNLASFNN
ncbi:chromosome segregation protein SMC [Companilactobacillus allii]|uniref:Chromosome partition protein Smc n=1 Tax=Companilactobacillus allii TaxID=1847728 RepID=A0A1P8Q414_9LACO|nr:chromosome segregation protein SMC [Companilactobacillus allii]APX72598.1 chromosome segregation protein SMC [Companilactobacillus allii]USQ69702.1 chromosome segregation protein SMC [Companilactobacillus allii]